MSIWDTLKDRLQPTPEKRASVSYEFASPEFIAVFSKTAEQIGMQQDELAVELDKLNDTYKSRTAS